VNPRLDWATDGAGWPHRSSSRFVRASGIDWHVQVLGDGPPMLLLHGTGASSHSFAGLAPLLARHYRVIVPDLPGHAFTGDGGPRLLSIGGMAQGLADLCAALDERPQVIVGHSAGMAIAVRGTIDGVFAPKLIVSINGAIIALRGIAAHLFSPMARLMSFNWFMPWIFAARAGDDRMIDRLLDGAGSTISPEGKALYAKLARSPRHVSAAFGMMANWDLPGVERDLPRLAVPLLLIAGARDRMIAPSQALEAAQRAPQANVLTLQDLGHLCHEEDPPRLAALIEDAARRFGVGGASAPTPSA
jgi:magnesium chelatase accessory protein